jgi:hypothetical protein
MPKRTKCPLTSRFGESSQPHPLSEQYSSFPQSLYLAVLCVPLCQRALLAFRAISRRLSALIDVAREGPPISPPLRADALFASTVVDSFGSAMAACTTRNARTFTSMRPPCWLDAAIERRVFHATHDTTHLLTGYCENRPMGGKLWDSLPDDSNSVRYLLQEQTEQNA